METLYIKKALKGTHDEDFEALIVEEGLPPRKQTSQCKKISTFISILALILTVLYGISLLVTYNLSKQNISLDQVMSFENWKLKFSKTYVSTDEENKRKSIFEANVQKMIEHNEKHDKMLVRHRHGLNKFSDLTTKEFLKWNHGKF